MTSIPAGSANRRHQGVAARYAAAKTWDEGELQGLVEAAEGKALLLVLDGVQDPHNLGACLRSAAGAAVTAVVIPTDKSVGVNATVRKTSAGAADRVPVFAVKCKNAINEPLFTGAPETIDDLNPYARIIADEAIRRFAAFLEDVSPNL